MKIKKNNNLDNPSTTLEHREIILNNAFLKKIYIDWYNGFNKYRNKLPSGKQIELGSGGGFLKEVCPDVITSDIMELEINDMTFSAENIPFDNESVSAIFMIDTLHHIPDSEKFLDEAQRVLKKGGAIYMIEPAMTPFSKFFYKNFHHEPCDPKVKEWKFDSKGPLSDANEALPWIIFKRDYDIFVNKFPQLELKSIKLHTPIKYFISGGLSYKPLAPAWAYSSVSFFEKVLTPIYPLIAMFQTIIVKKK